MKSVLPGRSKGGPWLLQVKYPASRKQSVTSFMSARSGRSRLLRWLWASKWVCQVPVIRAERLAEQTGAVTKAWVWRMPSEARRSMLGVETAGVP